MIDRRDFLKISAILGTGALVAGVNPMLLPKRRIRSFNLCTTTVNLKNNPDFLSMVTNSGVTDIWLPIFLNGYWAYPIEDLIFWKHKIEKAGLGAHMLSVPLGHPGNSLGGSPDFESTPKHWPRGIDIDGNKSRMLS